MTVGSPSLPSVTVSRAVKGDRSVEVRQPSFHGNLESIPEKERVLARCLRLFLD